MYLAVTALCAFLCLVGGAYALGRVQGARRCSAQRGAPERSEPELLEAVRVLVGASRESSAAVLCALESTLRVLESAIDTVLVFAPAGEELRCIHASGPRAAHYRASRMRIDDPAQLPARAAFFGHRAELQNGLRGVIPTDHAAVAVPMRAGDLPAAVVYASSTSDRLTATDALVRAIAHAAAPYALALEREADRAKATYDTLTGLYAPRAFRERLCSELAGSGAAPSAPLCLWFVDTDHFKSVNDTYGHAAGDVVLQRMAALLREHMVDGLDVAARNGGDEFCAILRETEKLAAIERAHRFCLAVRAYDFELPGISLTASVGVAAYPHDADDAASLLEAADAAMYHSKRSGRSRVAFAVSGGEFAAYE